MAFGKMLKLSALTTALMLAGCGGGDIVINSGSGANTGGGNPGDGSGTTPAVCPAFAKQGAAIGGVNKPICELTGTLTADATLTAGIVWSLNGKVAVGNDNANSATLTIEPGTTVFGKSGADFLVVARGSKLNAVGAANAPIVFTSVNDMIGTANDSSAGQWGGIVLLGKAPTNKCDPAALASCKIEAEGNAGPYGGDKPTDSSGILKYVQVKYAGYEVIKDNELNGITFAGVGSGTVVDYVQVHNNMDDGVEFFGGTVDVKHLVLTGNRDDSLDWADGWTGRAQHIYIRHDKNNLEANRGIEADNQSSKFDATPVSSPRIANVTIIGNTFKSADKDSEGVLLRAGTGGELYNFIITGPQGMGECFEIETPESVSRANSGKIVFRNSIVSCGENFKSPKDANGNTLLDVAKWFTAQPGNLVTDPLLGGYTPSSTSPALKNGYDVSNNVDPWFDRVSHIGAFDGQTDWTKGWTHGIHAANAAVAACPAGTKEVPTLTSKLNCELSGTITTNVTLKAGADYVLNGAVKIGNDNANSATLTIEPGVRVFGKSGADYLVIARGSKINAEGTQADPITFTSLQDAIGSTTRAGQWGGIVVLGNAPSNKCDQVNKVSCAIEAEGNAGPYGGYKADDNSGVLKYVVVKFAGYEVLKDNELNGITLAGVGSGTTVSHIQIHKNLDDGLELFGGTVNVKHVVLTGNEDDSLDWTDGWNGNAQFLLVKHDEANTVTNRGIEADNQSSAFSATPVSEPTIANMTIIGNTFKSADMDSEGVLLRAGTSAKLHNFVIAGPKTDTGAMGECLEIESDQSKALADKGQLVMTHSVIGCPEPFKGDVVANSKSVKQWFEAQQGNKVAANQAAVLNGIYTIDTTAAKDMSAVNPFFTKTSYVGAVDAASDWTKGWTVGLTK
jgi:hypothetical protein